VRNGNSGKGKLRRRSRKCAFPEGSWRKHEADGALEIVNGYSTFPADLIARYFPPDNRPHGVFATRRRGDQIPLVSPW
jgi:hypothetical protein